MMKYLKHAFLLFFTLLSFQSKAILFEIDIGAEQIEYTEIHAQQPFLDTDFKQTAAKAKFLTQFFILGKWMYANIEVGYSGVVVSSNTSDEMDVLNQIGALGVIIPSRPFNLTLVAEQFYMDVYSNSSNFGFSAAQGVQYYPFIDYTTDNGRVTFYFKYPLFGGLSNRQETGAGLHFRFGGTYTKDQQLINATILKFEYSDIELNFPSVRNVDVTIQSLTATLGWTF